MQKRYLLIGASRGIGGETSRYYQEKNIELLSVSRTPPMAGEWIQADISTPKGIEIIVDALDDRRLDALLFLGGTWEENAFTSEFDFLKSPSNEIDFVLSVNLKAPIQLAKALACNLSQSDNAKIILNGAMSGLSNSATSEVANTASKFGLQGVAEALNLVFASTKVSVSVVNLENVETEEVKEDIEKGHILPQELIPMSDVLATYDYILNNSALSIPQTINLVQRKP